MIHRSKLLLLVLVACCLSSARAAAQTVPEHDPRQARHRRVLLAEPMDALAWYWSAVPEQREGFASDWLEPGAGALELPGLEFLQDQAAGRSFEGDPPPRGSLARLARSIDVQVVPGAFEAGNSTPLRLRIWPWRTTSVSESVTVRVIWTGGPFDRTEARRATVDAGAWRAPGFDLFVTPPEGDPGTHTFRVEVAFSSAPERWVATRDFTVEGVEDFEARAASVRERFVSGEITEELLPDARDLLDLVDAGTRSPNTAPVVDRLEALEGGLPTLGPLGLGVGSRAQQAWRLATTADQPSGGVVLLISPKGYPTDAVLRGAQGAAWQAFADRTGFDCVSIPSTEPDELAARVADLGLSSADPIVCVPRGGAGLRALLALVGGEAPADYSWVLQRSGSGSIPSQMSDLFQGLWLVDSGSEPGPAEAAQTAPREASPLATDFSLPRLVGNWIESGGLKPAGPR